MVSVKEASAAPPEAAAAANEGAAVNYGKTRIKSLSVHIDNGRDLGNKVLHLTFKGGRNPEDLHVLKQYDVESRFAGWVTCFIDNDLHNHIKIEAKGPDNTLRLRQVKGLGYIEAGPMQYKQLRPQTIQQKNCEAETLRVFRLITSQVFGKLLEQPPDQSGGQSAASVGAQAAATSSSTQGASAASGGSTAVDGDQQQEPYLKEHVVGILFSRSKLSHLQKQVCSHIGTLIKTDSLMPNKVFFRDDTQESSFFYLNPIFSFSVGAIKREAGRLRDDWEVNLCSGGMASTPEASTDTYCFEMMSLVLALSGSSVGRTHLASQYAFVKDLLTLLHTATGRIQRQVIGKWILHIVAQCRNYRKILSDALFY